VSALSWESHASGKGGALGDCSQFREILGRSFRKRRICSKKNLHQRGPVPSGVFRTEAVNGGGIAAGLEKKEERKSIREKVVSLGRVFKKMFFVGPFLRRKRGSSQ